MERSQVLDWLREHPEALRGSPEEVVARWENQVRERTRQQAWLRAKQIAEEQESYWRGGFGSHASEPFVARELCRKLAGELKRQQPATAEGREAEFVAEDLLRGLEAEARALLFRYVRDLARAEEHRAWREVVQFTKNRGDSLARDRRFCSETRYVHTPHYAETAARVMHILADDYQEHAHPRAR